MRTSLNDLKQTEDFLAGKLNPQDSVLLRARLLIDPVLRMNMAIQQKIYSLITLYGRRRLKEEIEDVHLRIFKDPNRAAYREEITQLFSKH
jgi:hypothetical protein